MERCGVFAGAAAGQETLDADVFVEVRPFDRVAVAEQLPILSFILGGVKQARIPLQRNAERPSDNSTIKASEVSSSDKASGSCSRIKVPLFRLSLSWSWFGKLRDAEAIEFGRELAAVHDLDAFPDFELPQVPILGDQIRSPGFLGGGQNLVVLGIVGRMTSVSKTTIMGDQSF